MIVVDLPFPPSMNSIWRAGRKRVFKSPKYKSWSIEAYGEWLLQKDYKKFEPIDGFYTLHAIFNAPDKRQRDLGNLEKVCSDFAQTVGIIKNDSLCMKMVLEYGNKKEAPLGARLVFEPW